jgi:tRNA G18 (ribose-2'-O)-methylase SpoU
MRKLTHPELIQRQAQRRNSSRLPFQVVLNHVRSLYNVGSIFRTADGVGVEKIWLCGITGAPPKQKILKTALGAEQTVPWEHRWDVLEVVRELKAKGFRIVLVEQLEQSRSIDGLEIEGPVCVVLGNEITGVSDELLELCDDAVEIDMIGLKNSLNVTVAFGVVAYHIRKNFLLTSGGVG